VRHDKVKIIIYNTGEDLHGVLECRAITTSTPTPYCKYIVIRDSVVTENILLILTIYYPDRQFYKNYLYILIDPETGKMTTGIRTLNSTTLACDHSAPQ